MEKLPESENKFLGKYEIDEDGYVDLKDIALGELGMSTKSVANFVRGMGETTLDGGLKIKHGDPDEYYNLRIHKDDAAEFAKRIMEKISPLEPRALTGQYGTILR